MRSHASVLRWKIAEVALAFWVMASAATFAHAGECVEGDEAYVQEMERIAKNGPPFSPTSAMSCLLCTPKDWGRWAGPIAADRFDSCRRNPLRDRIAAAALPLLDDPKQRPSIAYLAATYGFSKIGKYDLFEILTSKDPKDRFWAPPLIALAIQRDPRIVAYLTNLYESIKNSPAANQPKQAQLRRNLVVQDILNCLYHQQNPDAAKLAAGIKAAEKDPELRARAQKVIDHSASKTTKKK